MSDHHRLVITGYFVPQHSTVRPRLSGPLLPGSLTIWKKIVGYRFTAYGMHTYSVCVRLSGSFAYPDIFFVENRCVRLRAGFHCGSAALLLVFRGLKRHHYHSDRGSSWSSEFAAHRELLLRFLTKNCEPRSRLDLFPVLCIVLYARIFIIQILIRCAGQNTRICLISRARARARAGR